MGWEALWPIVVAILGVMGLGTCHIELCLICSCRHLFFACWFGLMRSTLGYRFLLVIVFQNCSWVCELSKISQKCDKLLLEVINWFLILESLRVRFIFRNVLEK